MDSGTRRRFLGVLLLTVLALGCSDGGGGAKSAAEEAARERLSTAPADESDCTLIPPTDVGTAFSEPVEFQGQVAGRCGYTIGAAGQAGFQLLDEDDRPLEVLAPGGMIIDDLGTAAVWAPVGSEGGLLAVRMGGDVALFDVTLPDSPDLSLTKAVGWARLTLPRLEQRPQSNAEASTSEPVFDPCDLLTDDERDEVLGVGWREVSAEGGICTLATADDVEVEVGPRRTPATQASLDNATRVQGSGDERAEWPRTPIPDVGSAAVAISPPGGGDYAELYVLDGVALLRVTVDGAPADRANLIAIAVALAAI